MHRTGVDGAFRNGRAQLLLALRVMMVAAAGVIAMSAAAGLCLACMRILFRIHWTLSALETYTL
jgi:hypothetical protein